MNFYISDLHIGHENVIRFDNRPFANADEMNDTIFSNWNSRVTRDDTVYILGDFIWHKESKWYDIVSGLTGNKVLVRGNHDPRQYSSNVKNLFQDITNIKEIVDEGRHVLMSIIRYRFSVLIFLKRHICCTVMCILQRNMIM